MGNNHSRIAPTRTLHVIDSQSRARYQNQRELIHYRRKLNIINAKHGDNMARLALQRHDAKTALHQIQHHIAQKELAEKLEKRGTSTSKLSFNEYDPDQSLTLESPSLLLHNLNASNEWEKSFTLPNIHDELLNRSKPLQNVDELRTRYSSKADTSSHLFDQSEYFISSKKFSVKKETERMKKSIQVAMVKSVRDAKVAARRSAYQP